MYSMSVLVWDADEAPPPHLLSLCTLAADKEHIFF